MARQPIVYGPYPNNKIAENPWYAWKKTDENFIDIYNQLAEGGGGTGGGSNNYRILFSDASTHINQGITQTDLYNFNIPANTLTNDNDVVNIKCSIQTNTTDSIRVARLFLAGQNTDLNIGLSQITDIDIYIFRLSATTARYVVNIYGDGQTFGRAIIGHTVVPTISMFFVGAINIRITGQGNASGHVVGIYNLVSYMSSQPSTSGGGGGTGDFVPITRKVNGHALDSDITITKDDLGLDQVDNTADVDKPVTTAVTNLLTNKIDKEVGKGLSTNDFDNIAVTALANKVDKATGYKLMSDEESIKLASLSDHFRGTFESISALETAIPVGNAGDTANVDSGIPGSTVAVYNWSVINTTWQLSLAIGNVTSVNSKTGAVIISKTDLGLENVVNLNTTLPENIQQNAFYRLSTDTEKATWTAKQDAIGYTPEDQVLKTNDTTIRDSVHYPTTDVVHSLIDSSLVGLLVDQGNYDASVNTFPTTGRLEDAIQRGYLWYITVAGTLGGVPVFNGYSIRALVNFPDQDVNNWAISNVGLGYIPENSSNKSTDNTLGGGTPSNIKFPVEAAVKSYTDTLIATKQNNLGFTPESISNKVSNLTSPNSTTFPNTLAVINGITAAVADKVIKPTSIIVGNLYTFDALGNLVDTGYSKDTLSLIFVNA